MNRVAASESAVEKARRLWSRSGSKSGWLNQRFNLSATPSNFPKSFFAQAAALPALRLPRDIKPPQQAPRQRPCARGRSCGARSAGLLLQSRPPRRLRAHVFLFPGRDSATPHLHGVVAVEVADPVAGGRLAQGRGRKTAAALRAGIGLSAAAQITPATGPLAFAALSRANTSPQRAVRSVVADGGTSPGRLRAQ